MGLEPAREDMGVGGEKTKGGTSAAKDGQLNAHVTEGNKGGNRAGGDDFCSGGDMSARTGDIGVAGKMTRGERSG